MRKLVFMSVIALCVTTSCTKKEETPLSGIEFGKQEVTLDPDEELQLSLFPIPDNATLPDCLYFSDDEKIATISKTGLVKAISSGITTVSAKTPDGEYYAPCSVTVTGFFKEPYLEFGATVAKIKGYETRELYQETDENVYFYGENEDVALVAYSLKNKLLSVSAIIFNRTETSFYKKVKNFITTKYPEYIGKDSDGDEYYTDGKTKAVVYLLNVNGNGYVTISYSKYSASQSSPLRSTDEKENVKMDTAVKKLIHETLQH